MLPERQIDPRWTHDGAVAANGRRVPVTVAELRLWLSSFEDDAEVVVPCGIGYEAPHIKLVKVRPVVVPGRYVSDSDGGHVAVFLAPVNG